MAPPLKEGEDFYFNDKGLMVLTEKYHQKRGTCCGNRCKHCPYDWRNVKTPSSSPSKGVEKNPFK